MHALNAYFYVFRAHAACVTLLILTNPSLIPHKNTTNPINPINHDLEIQRRRFMYLKIRINRVSGIRRLFVWG